MIPQKQDKEEMKTRVKIARKKLSTLVDAAASAAGKAGFLDASFRHLTMQEVWIPMPE